ncbi:MAG: DUF4255 domain-containing protein [Gemmatimonadaceae bacterium]
MSTALALASVTALLKDLLENGLASAGVTAQIGGDATVSAMPPDRVGSGADEKAQLNVFLYHVSPYSRMQLDSPPGNGRGTRRLALELHYLLTAYGAQDYQTEILLGHALQLLHESPVLERERIRSSLESISHTRDRRVISPAQAALASSALADQVEDITITPEFLSTEEISKLWSAMQAKYRPSATYKVSAVFIEAMNDSAKSNRKDSVKDVVKPAKVR